jgi:hypothetical protein
MEIRTRSLLVVLPATTVLLCCTGFARAQQGWLGVTLDTTYMSKYMVKGVEGYGQQGIVFETLGIDLWGTGFGLSLGHQGPTSAGYVDKSRFNYCVHYGSSAFGGESYETKYKLSWTYKNYYDRPRNVGNTEEWILGTSWPKILPVENLTPFYIAHYEHPAGSNYDNRKTAGFVHRFGLGYDLPVSGLENALHLSSEIAYRDGLGGPARDHDWSHSTLGISTRFNIADNLSLVPGLYHQLSMDDSVSKRDVTYCKISVKYEF